ncbi:17-beta-hydroxysteroid dehydrogenase 13-like [Trichogramma pretiosum]|uniref:17-beta-hydroxysteroid dehydrogenase 13-like n=1 Tax=Trichogramma pretiosum TaxID=7493 RepID=UPI0006C9915B|nr:17-beta-hydroxysteroid dehydrogenase 13-like [Trichogramma pretiosum]
MLLRLYSLIVLSLDVLTLLIGIWFSMLLAIYRTFRPPGLKSVHGEVALVVGAGRGVGREIAIQLAQLGVSVACVDVNNENCQATVNKALQLSCIARAYICDVTKEKQISNTIEAIRRELGEVTMLFHCCGVPSPRTLSESPPNIRSLLDTAILSHFLLLDAALPGMHKVSKGHIVVLSSVAGLSGVTNRQTVIPLSTAQFAVQGFAESLQANLRHSRSNINISLIHVYPFMIGTESIKDIRFRIPSYFGTIHASEAARRILDGVRRNYSEFSVPGYLLYLGHILRILPKKASFMLRDLLDTGVDFA